MQDWVLEILRCPVTLTPLQMLDEETLQSINNRIAAGELSTRSGQTVTEPLQAAFINESRSLVYAIVDDIPNLIPDDAIVVGEVPASSSDKEQESE